ncbi:hypothetical protein BGZ80_005841 [Entomortierella chlamydospora]|uniref:Uncharacterized protein n=1 Tax=Entomortierella chlamydospora TaxID=101097 RepID=A0A9P6N0H0_9FUNG|nr:hypothetical protein BGZ80_005841 [Entomortierella chlamydospora]
MWSSFVHAALHYSRLAWDLSPVGQKSQISIHVAPGPGSTLDSIVLNDWATQEQNLGNITSQLKELQTQDDLPSEEALEDTRSQNDWIGQALKGAIAHILEPTYLQTPALGPSTIGQSGSPQLRVVADILMVLVDPEGPITEVSEDTDMNEDTEQGWQYRGLDLRKALAEALRSLQECVKNNRTCTASVYNVVSSDEVSTTKALTNHYLLQNKDIQLLRLNNLPLKHHSGSPIELFYRTDHIVALARRKPSVKVQGESTPILQTTPRTIQDVVELNYGMDCAEIPRTVHLLTALGSDGVASKALFDHSGQLFVHCLQTQADKTTFASEALLQTTQKRKMNASGSGAHVEEFVEVIVRPNTIIPGTDSFAQEGNIFTEIVPPALKSLSSQRAESENEIGSNAEEEGLSSLGVNMGLVHTTSKLDLETRWLPAYSTHIQKFKTAICRSSVDAAGISIIQSVLDALICDARPLVLPGESGPAVSQHQQRFRESAQAILADLWMIGQRFKSVSPSHVEVAKLIATKITPKGLDHQTVKLTLVPPNRRAALMNSDAQGGSPVVDGGDMGGDGWGRNKGQRGGGNVGSGIGRGGRGGRFDSNRGGRGGGIGAGGRGRGGFRGSHNNNNPGNSGAGTAADDMNFGGVDPSVGDIMVSMTGKTQPVPYLITQPPTREEIEEAEHEYLAQLGEDGCLLKAYWGSRGAQGSAIATVLNSVTSLDSPSATARSNNGPGVGAPGAPIMDPIAAAALVAQQKMKRLSTKRPRLQDFAGRTPVSENGGFRQ